MSPVFLKRTISLIVILILWNCEANITTECDVENELQPTLTSIQAQVFNAYCVSCHSGSSPSGELDLSAGNAFTNLVNVPSVASGLKRVVPGNSAQSYLILRLNGANNEPIMPPGGKLAPATIQTIAQWIDAGAENN